MLTPRDVVVQAARFLSLVLTALILSPAFAALVALVVSVLVEIPAQMAAASLCPAGREQAA